MNNKNSMMFNKNHYTVISNGLARGKQKMSLQTARLIRLMITQIVKEDKDLKTYICKITELAEFLNIPSSNLYRDVESICDEAMKSVIYVGTGNPKAPWEMYHWVDTAKYDGKGTITLRLSDEVKQFVLELDKWFTQYQFKNILSMNSFYAIRLYELIKCEDGIHHNSKDFVQFSIEELRTIFDCQKKYKLFDDFKKKTINIAVNEINKKTDIYIEPEFIKTSRSYTDVKFYIRSNNNKIKRKSDNDE